MQGKTIQYVKLELANMSIDYFGKEGMSYKIYNFYNRKSIQSIKAQPPKKGTFYLNSVHFVDSDVHHFIMNYYVQESVLHCFHFNNIFLKLKQIVLFKKEY